MTPHEYALNCWEIPAAEDALKMCQSLEEARLFVGCVYSKRIYAKLHESFWKFGGQHYLESAQLCGQQYLSELKRLEEMR